MRARAASDERRPAAGPRPAAGGAPGTSLQMAGCGSTQENIETNAWRSAQDQLPAPRGACPLPRAALSSQNTSIPASCVSLRPPRLQGSAWWWLWSWSRLVRARGGAWRVAARAGARAGAARPGRQSLEAGGRRATPRARCILAELRSRPGTQRRCLSSLHTWPLERMHVFIQPAAVWQLRCRLGWELRVPRCSYLVNK